MRARRRAGVRFLAVGARSDDAVQVMRGLWQAGGAQRRNLGLRNEALPVQRDHAQRDALLRGGDGGGSEGLHGLQVGLLRRARPGGPRTRVPDAPVDMRRHGGAGAVADIDLIAQRAGVPHAQQPARGSG